LPQIRFQDVTQVEDGGHMNILKHSRAVTLQARRLRREPDSGAWNYASLANSRALVIGRRQRERILALLALITLVVAWDMTLRLDEQTAPPRMRTSHAVEIDAEPQTLASVE
jgi:hypothetical protein